MKRTKEEAEITKHNIITAAQKIFTTKGYRATSLEDIAEEAGVTKGAIYWHFKNKYDLFNQLVVSLIPNSEGLLEIARSDELAKNKVAEVIMYFLQVKGHKRDNKYFFELVQVIDANREELSELHELINKNRDKTISIISSIIEEGKKAMEISPGVDSVVAGHAIFSYGTGFLMLHATGCKFDIKKHLEKIVNIFIKGLM